LRAILLHLAAALGMLAKLSAIFVHLSVKMANITLKNVLLVALGHILGNYILIGVLEAKNVILMKQYVGIQHIIHFVSSTNLIAIS
jgi:hypothetical protein